MIEKEILDNHVIYGTWDDVHGYQFLVYYHPNGRDATVFIMAGTDYGGGIAEHGDVLSKDLDKLILEHSNDGYSLYSAVRDLLNN